MCKAPRAEFRAHRSITRHSVVSVWRLVREYRNHTQTTMHSTSCTSCLTHRAWSTMNHSAIATLLKCMRLTLRQVLGVRSCTKPTFLIPQRYVSGGEFRLWAGYVCLLGTLASLHPLTFASMAPDMALAPATSVLGVLLLRASPPKLSRTIRCKHVTIITSLSSSRVRPAPSGPRPVLLRSGNGKGTAN